MMQQSYNSPTRKSVAMWLSAGCIGLVMASAGDAIKNPDIGYWKTLSAVVACGCFYRAIGVADEAELFELKQLMLQEEDLKHDRQMRQLENMEELHRRGILGEKRLEAWEVEAENLVMAEYARRMGIPMSAMNAAIDVPAQSVQAQPLPHSAQPNQAVQDVPVTGNPPTPTAIPVPSAIVAPSQTIQPAIILPDGAKLVEASALANINEYPVVFIVAVPGNGKTLTTEWVISQLPGKKVLCSHKAEGYHRSMFDFVFGYNPYSHTSRWCGDNSTITTDDRDFGYISAQQSGYGTVAEGYWSLFSEIGNRQKLGPTAAAKLEPYRNFYDESSYAYSTAFQDPLNPELLKWGQSLVSSANKIVFFDGRSNGCQVFFAAQSDSVDIIGLKGLANARDEMWFMYPGKAAIAYAKQKGKQQLANWLESRLNQGYAIAILVKQDVFWCVLNLPKVSELMAWEEAYKVEQPQSHLDRPQPAEDNIYHLVAQAKNEQGKAA